MNTDIEKIKNIALLFLNLPYDVNNNDIGLFLYHPIIRDVYQVLVDEYGKHEIVNILEKDNWEKIVNQFKEFIMKVKKIEDFYMIFNKPYFGVFFKYINQYLSIEDYNSFLKYLWVYMEYPNNDKNVSKKEFIEYFKKIDKNIFMNKEEIDVYNNLPDEIVVYRGVKPNSTYKALSWTLNLDTATWFADRFEKDGKVYKATINKKYVFTYIGERNEFEVVLDYRKLKNIEIKDDVDE